MIDIKRFILIPVSKLVFAEWNYKTDDDTKKEKLRKNLKRNGQIENIIVREIDTDVYEVINGNHRLRAMRENGQGEAFCYRYKLGELSDTQAKRIACELDLEFEIDHFKFSKTIESILEDFSIDDLETTLPLDKQEIENLVKEINFDWTEPVFKPGIDKQEKPLKRIHCVCPQCGYEFETEGTR